MDPILSGSSRSSRTRSRTRLFRLKLTVPEAHSMRKSMLERIAAMLVKLAKVQERAQKSPKRERERERIDQDENHTLRLRLEP